MSGSSVPGLQSALRAYDSDKVRERAEGAARLREIFSNRENLLSFDRTASRDGGEGWVALFQCLFQVVVLEKKNWLRKVNSGPQAERRLEDAISLVRWLAERSVHLISRKPVQALITHMTTLLVYSGQLFSHAAIDYAKAIRSLLSYPPHLNELDPNTWRILMGVCWSAVLGDQVSVDGEFEGDLAENDDSPVVPLPTQAPASIAKGRTNVTQATNELAQLIPLLLSSTSAPITPPLPITGLTYEYEQSLALTMLYKASRFYAQQLSETTSHLPIVRSTNFLLSVLELNSRHDIVAAGMRLLPQLINLWPTRNKAIREQILIALRTMLPFLVHKNSLEKDRLGLIRNSLERLMDVLPKESTSRWGFEAIELNTVRLQTRIKGEKNPAWTKAFERRVLRAGFEFSHDSAMRWTVVELYSEVCYHLYHTIDPPNAVTPSRGDSTQSKRRKISDPLTNLIAATRHGAYGTRLQALQTIIFLVDQHWEDVHLELQTDIRQQMIALLDEDEPSLQSWAFIGIATLATLPARPASASDLEAMIPSPVTQARALSAETDFARAWTYAIQKTGLVGVYRSACLAAHSLLKYAKVDSTIAIKDIGFVLEGVDIRGPPFPLDSACALLDEMLTLARQDVRLYSIGLEAKVVSWFAKWNAVEGMRGKGRIDQHFLSDILPLLCNSAHLQSPVFYQPSTLDFLPDCAIVDRVLEEERTQPIRQFSLYGTISDTRDIVSPSRAIMALPEVDLSSAAFLDGLPRRISDTITSFVETFCQTWPAQVEGEARPAIPADRCRRTVDMLVLAINFQATLQANSIRSDSTCIQASLRLLDLLLPVLKSSGYDVISQHLMWKGLEPLIYSIVPPTPSVWPILLRPNEMSGVRKDILPKGGELAAEKSEEERAREDDFLVLLWEVADVGNALKGLSDVAFSLFAGSDTLMPLDASEPSGTREEDDDFGEIRIAETDAIPVSQEASECQRTTSSFLSILARFRLRQAMLTSPNRVPSVDKDLLNAFLSAEGPRFVQLGSVICDAIKDGILRLTANTVNVTLERLEDVTQSYVYRGHEGLLRMTLAFMTGSIVVWLSPHGDKYELLGRVFHLADALRNRASRKALPSWRVRLDLVRFIDEYLDYDPDQTAWQEYTSSQSQMITDGSVPLATDIVSAALTDVDSRVRFRGATSAAGTMYLSSLPPELHLPFYQTCVEEQPRELRHWDAFITDMLFKLNCCVTSPQVRAATIYHLYEVPQAIHDYDGHLENGLSTVATRLGLSGIAPLSLAHAPLVFMSQILAQQSPMRVPHRLYGFSTRKAFAIHALESAGSQLVLLAVAENVRSDPESRQYVGAGDTLTGICAAAGIPSADIIVRHFPAAAAHFLADPTCPPFFNVLGDDFTCEHAVRLIPSIIELVRGATLPKDPLADNVEEVITNLFVLLDLADTDEDVVEILRRKIGDDHGAPTVYATLMSCQPPVPASALALLPGASAERIMDALVYLSQNYKTISSAKVLFNTLTRLFHRINDDFLISEQYRHLRGIALATSLYGEELTHPAILGYFLRETLPLLKLSSVAPAILSMLKFGFEQISRAPKAPDDFDQLIIALGSTRVALTDDESNEELVQQFDSWIVKQAPVWQDVEAMRPALTVARSTWPEHLANVLDKVGSPSFNEICDSSERLHTTDVLPMCEAMVKSLEPDPAKNKDDLELFQRRAFWHIKRHLPPTPRNVDSVSAFIDILYAGHGQVHPPGLDMAQLPPGIAWLQEMLRKKEGHPSRALRTMMLDRIVLMARLPAYQARTAALSTLQMLLACIKDEGDSKNGHGTEKSESRATNDFLALLTPASPPPPSSVPAFSTLVTDDTWLKHARDTSIWSTALATFIAFTLAVRERFYAALPDLFAAIPSAAGDLLPLLVQASLAVEADQRGDLKERHSTYTKYLTKVLASPQSSVDTLRVIVDISLHLRYLNPPYKRSDELAFEKWLDIDPMLLSEAALRCGNYATALMYLENVRSDAKSAPRDIDMFDNRVQKILYESYSNVEDPDGFYGIQTHDVFDHLHRRVQHEGDHWRSFGLHGALLESGPGASETASTSLLAMRDLHNLGFNQVSNSIFASVKSSNDRSAGTAASATDPLLFELAWRTSDWDLPLPPVTSSDTLLYTALRAVHRERDLSVAEGIVDRAIGSEVNVLRDCGVERTGMIKKSVNNLICLNEVKKWLASGQSTSSEADTKEGAESGWARVAHLDEAFAFADAERIMATRRSLIAASRSREAPQVFGDLHTPRLTLLNTLDVKALLRTGQLARAEGNIQASINALVAATKLDTSTEIESEAVQDEFAQVLWAQNEHMLAIQHVDERVKRVRKAGNAGGRLAVLLGQMAHWTSRAKSRAPPDIRLIFEEATKLAEAHKLSIAEMGELFHNFATFADSHQRDLSRSPEIERLNTMASYRDSGEARTSTPAPGKRITKSSARTEMTDQLDRELREEEEAMLDILASRSNYAKLALRSFAKSLAFTDQYNDSTTRMISLWLEFDEDEDVNTAFAGLLSRVPSHKFLFLSPQLSARLDKKRNMTAFNNALNALVYRICQQHPYHILYQVITLADGAPKSTTKGKRASDVGGGEGRGVAAAAILATLAASNSEDNALARNASHGMHKLAEAASKWCLTKRKEEERPTIGRGIDVPPDCPLRHLPTNLDIPVATTPPPPDPTGRYERIPTLIRYRSTYAVLGGIHRPKRMLVYDSNAVVHIELFKGEDELRQDAVMEQVFEMSNALLRRDRKTRERDLRFRTYVVIPLANKTGIMEFVGDSQAIGDWLKPAHKRYGVANGDMDADDIRRSLKPLQDKEKLWNQLPAKFEECMKDFHPVFRHFFTDKHRDPMAWFTMRLNYTRSVAVTSIIGWILGVGDRHCSNILIDKKSGELVHIDFGIVFEDGRRLRIPEKVPFRLTNDLVDGFGLMGVEGTFRRCSEHTLRVLRESSDVIMTVLEVFKHDPLYAWDADPEKLQRAQGGGRVSAGSTTSASALEKAERILSKIRGKLRPDLSIEYTVNQLIQEARDVENLAKIFVGWQPWF